MKSVLVILVTLLVIGCSGSDNHECENEIISHELRNEYGEIVDSIGYGEYLEIRWNFQVCEANLEKLCGYFYPDYHYSGDHELVCYDLYPSSVGKTLAWQPGQLVWGDMWTDVWLVYDNEKVSPVYTVFIDVE